ncbi:hypothetical protein KI659_17600 [Litoribacter alkaliphilus]|uniref:Preprotein translocase subunit SecB n=1 Tax=Litoribacter ruber TaxID=702568 RepID=A0AAP2CNK9_9BACT|nr:hypothetical protein [Litoribacter alkaliphilus]MBS9525840.1 hypothetical protein [Litoribacter alkaliphilus]
MNVIPDKIQIVDVELLEFSFNRVGETNSSIKQVPSLEIGMHHELSKEDRILKFVFDGKLELKNEAQDILCKCNFKCSFVLKVENLDDFKREDGETIKFDPIIGLTCTGITYSTLRGIVFSKLLGTPLEHYMLPVIDPKSLMR